MDLTSGIFCIRITKVFLVSHRSCHHINVLLCRDAFPYNWPIVMMAILGKMCITATFAIIYLYSCEIYPTVVRSVGVSSSSVFARIGGGVAPFVGSLDKVHVGTCRAIHFLISWNHAQGYVI